MRPLTKSGCCSPEPHRPSPLLSSHTSAPRPLPDDDGPPSSPPTASPHHRCAVLPLLLKSHHHHHFRTLSYCNKAPKFTYSGQHFKGIASKRVIPNSALLCNVLLRC